MREAGIDISGRESTVVTNDIIAAANVVVTVCGHADEQCPVLPPAVTKLHWPLNDPAKATGTEQEITGEFRATRNEIERRVRELIVHLRNSSPR
jgi:arsenate reductase